MPKKEDIVDENNTSQVISYETKTFNSYIERLRKENNWTYKETAKQLGYTDRYLRYLRKGEMKSNKAYEKVRFNFRQTHPINYVGVIHLSDSFSGKKMYVVKFAKVRSFNAGINYLREMQIVFGNNYTDGFTSDNKLETAQHLRIWQSTYNIHNHVQTQNIIFKLES